MHEQVEDVSFFMGGLGYRLGQVELEKEIHYSSRGGVLRTIVVDIEVTNSVIIIILNDKLPPYDKISKWRMQHPTGTITTSI